MAAGMDQGSVSGKEQPSMTKLGSGEERPSSMEQPGTTKSEVGGTVEEIGAGHIIDGKIKPKGKLDAAAEFLRLHEGEHVDFTKKEANHVRWKADLRILPLMTGTVVLTAVDKIMISNAAVYGMTDDLNLHGQQYSWAASIFYFGYLVAQFPANWLIQRYPVGKLVGICCFSWGVLTMLMGVTHNAAGLLTLRFFLGIAEAVVFPANAIITVMWYKQKEQPVRAAIWLGQWSSLVVGLLSYGIGHSHTAVASWRVLFLVPGAFTVLWGILLYFFLPDSPVNCRFLSHREKFIAVSRIRENMTGIENKRTKWYQVREAFTDWMTWPPFFFVICNQIANGGLVIFSGLIVSGLGFSKLETTLLGIPTGMIATFAGILMAYISARFKNGKCITTIVFALIPIACAILMMKLPSSNKYGRLTSYYCFYFYAGGYPLINTVAFANTSGHSKKVTRNAIMFLAYCIGNIISPQFFKTSEAPRYPTGYSAILGAFVAAIFILSGFSIGVVLVNRKNSRKPPAQSAEEEGTDLYDITDREKKGFVYVY